MAVGPLRAAVLATGEDPRVIALRLGWFHKKFLRRCPCCGQTRKGVTRVPDARRVRQTLGLAHYWPKPGVTAFREHIDYTTALAITEAAGLDPVDVGL